MMRAVASVWMLLAVLASGCSHYEPLSLHGAGSMRIEVEVYKGPLTLPVSGQVGELVAILSDSIHALHEWRLEAEAMRSALTCPSEESWNETRPMPENRRDCRALNSVYASSGDMLDFACYITATPTLRETVGAGVYLPVTTCGDRPSESLKKPYFDELKRRLDGCKAIRASEREPSLQAVLPPIAAALHCEGEIIAIAFDNLATVMRSAAFRAADGNIRSVPQNRDVRGLVTALAFIASEYGNQVQARITVLQKELTQRSGPNPKVLPTSDYLREAGRTDFIQLYDWLHATADRGPALFRGKLSTEERIRMAQRLSADYYWQKVEDVYASGQGDVSMAFIKDDLGNWDLKSFSNDPAELLKSYRQVTTAAFASAAKLVRSAATGGGSAAVERVSAAARAANLADQLATGENPGSTTAPGLDPTALHDRAAARIAAQQVRFKTKLKALDASIAAHEAELAKAKADQANVPADADTGKLAEAAAAVREAEVAKAADEQRRADLPKEAVAVVRDMLDDHLAVVAALQEAVVAAPTPPPSSAPQ